MRTALLLVPFSLTCALFACSGDESTPATDGSSSGNTAPSGSSGSSGNAERDASSSGNASSSSGNASSSSGDAAAPTELSGSVVLTHTSYEDPHERASAVFGARDDSAARLTRVQATTGAVRDGSCVYVPRFDAADDPTWQSQSAGELTFRHRGSQRSLRHGQFGEFYSERYTDEPILGAAGGEVEVEAAGGTVAPFTGRFSVPPATTLTAPVMDDAQRIEMGPGASLALAWAPTSAGVRFTFGMYADVELGVTRALLCDFDGTAGNGEVPAALLQNYQNEEVVHASAYTTAASTVTAGTHEITLEGQQAVVIGDGSVFKGALLFGGL